MQSDKENSQYSFDIEQPTTRQKVSPLFSTEKAPSYIASLAIIFIIFFLDGALQGYGEAVEIIVLQDGATFNDESILSLMSYPYLAKMFIAPFMEIVRIPPLF